MSDHAQLSPSKRDRWARCPGSIREEARYPQGPGGAAAIDGTHSHTLLDKCIQGWRDTGQCHDPLGMVGVTMEDHEGTFVVDAERAKRVKVATDYVNKRLAEIEDMAQVHGETRVSLKHLTNREDLDGTFDIRIIGNRVCEIIDYKDGMHPVPADCMQLEQYAIGTLSGYGLPINGTYPFDEIRQTVIQPKLAYKGADPISSVTIPVHEYLQGTRLGALVAQAKATEYPDAPLVAGEAQCRYCPHKGACSAYAEFTMGKMGMFFQTVTVKEDAVTTPEAPVLPAFLAPEPVTLVAPAPLADLVDQSAASDPATMSNDRIRQILEAAPLLRQLIESVEEEAMRRLKAGIDVPGLKVVNGRGSRKWSLPEDQIAEKLKGMQLPKDVIWQTKLISPAQIEKATWKNRKGEVKQLSERQLKTIDKEYVAKLSGSLTVVLASDSRPAVTLNAAPMFDAVSAQPAPILDLPDWMK